MSPSALAPPVFPDDPTEADPAVGLTALAVLGLGFVAMAADLPAFWAVWAVGFGAVVPAVALLRRRGDDAEDGDGPVSDATDDVDAALATLRERYARGDLSEAAFEAKLEALLETETPEDARERLRRERSTETEADAET
jgi:uncharacterized membrane protein